MHRCGPTLGMLLIVALANTAPGRSVGAQALDSTGMPPLEQLAQEAGRASRRSPIRTVARAFLCDPTHPLVDSASVAACAALDSTRSVAITAAFARGLEVPIAATADTSAAPDLAICPDDLEHANGPRVLLARVTAPVVGIVYVESDKGAPERLTGVSLFADVVAPILRDRYGWGDKPCMIARQAGETP